MSDNLTKLERRWVLIASSLLLFHTFKRRVTSGAKQGIAIYIVNFSLAVDLNWKLWRIQSPIFSVGLVSWVLFENGIKLPTAREKARAADWAMACLVWQALVYIFHRPDSTLKDIWFIRFPSGFLSTAKSKMVWTVFAYMAYFIPSVYGTVFGLPLKVLFYIRHFCRGLGSVGLVSIVEYVDDAELIEWFRYYRPFFIQVFADCVLILAEHFALQLSIWTVYKLIFGPHSGSWFSWWHCAIVVVIALRPELSAIRWRYRLHGLRYYLQLSSRLLSQLRNPPSLLPRYRYSPLPATSTTTGPFIRLLLVHPRHRDHPVSCTLFSVPLESAPRFEAISYRWTDPSESGSDILLNFTTAFRVPANVYELLQDFRSPVFPRLLWIDSICINQHDRPERSQQVSMMGDIYTRASLVTVWLGSPAAEVALGLWQDLWRSIQTNTPQFLRDKLGELPPRYANMLSEDRVDESQGVRKYRHKLFKAIYAAMVLTLLDHLRSTDDFRKDDYETYIRGARYRRTPLWRPLMHLLEHDWFERVWIVQEVVLARSVRVLYGGLEADWEDFADGLTVLGENKAVASLLDWTDDEQVRSTVRARHVQAIMMMESWRYQMMRKGPMGFRQVVYDARLLRATDPRDKIFGFHGLVAKGLGSWTEPDYEIGAADVFVNAAVRLIHEDGILDLISHAGVGYIDNRAIGVQGLPSWVPDWTLFPETAALSLRGDFKNRYRAGGTKGTSSVHNLRRDSSGKPVALCLQGILLDVVVELAPPYVIHLNSSANYEYHVHAGLRSAAETLKESGRLVLTSRYLKNPYPHTEKPTRLGEAFWRLLIGDRTTAEWPAPASVEQLAIAWTSAVSGAGQLNTVNELEAATEEEIRLSISNQQYGVLITKAWSGRRVAVTRKGYVCLLPRGAMQGDIIWLVEGAQTPFVFRKEEKSICYQLVGDCYVHGVMDGSAFDEHGDLQTITVV